MSIWRWTALAVSLCCSSAYAQGPYWETMTRNGDIPQGAHALEFDYERGYLYAGDEGGWLWRNTDPANSDVWTQVDRVLPDEAINAQEIDHIIKKGDWLYVMTTKGFYRIDDRPLDQPVPGVPIQEHLGLEDYYTMGSDPTGDGVIVWLRNNSSLPAGPYRYDPNAIAAVDRFTPIFDGLPVHLRDQGGLPPMRTCGGELYATVRYQAPDAAVDTDDDGGIWKWDGTWSRVAGSKGGTSWGLMLGPNCEIFQGKAGHFYLQFPGGAFEKHTPYVSQVLPPQPPKYQWFVFVEPEAPENCTLIAGGSSNPIRCLTGDPAGGSAPGDWLDVYQGGGSDSWVDGFAVHPPPQNILYYGRASHSSNIGDVYRTTKGWTGACASIQDQGDADGDGVRDFCDACVAGGPEDRDEDGICDADDLCPDDPQPQIDTDGDGVGDDCDACPGLGELDADHNGICDAAEQACPPDGDRDGDGTPDDADDCPTVPNAPGDDMDGDGIGDACDICPNGPNDAHSDGDGVCDSRDNCPADDNIGQLDADGDGIGDACDDCTGADHTDTDGDGTCDADDRCPLIQGSPHLDADGDGIGDACDPCPALDSPDADQDGACDAIDNCPGDPNARQLDQDGDGVGDACDACPGGDDGADADADGVCDALDVCPGAPDAGQDTDGDGIDDACDACPGMIDAQQDSDGDGTDDACDLCIGAAGFPDSDGDGTCDPDDNCPGVANAAQFDADADGLGEACDSWTDLRITEARFLPVTQSFLEVTNTGDSPLQIPEDTLLVQTFDDQGGLRYSFYLEPGVLPPGGAMVAASAPAVTEMVPAGVPTTDVIPFWTGEIAVRILLLEPGGPVFDGLSMGGIPIANGGRPITQGLPAADQSDPNYFTALTRCDDQGDNAQDFDIRSMTPGLVHDCPPSGGIEMVFNEVDYDDGIEGQGRQFAELLNTHAAAAYLPMLWVQVVSEADSGPPDPADDGFYWLMHDPDAAETLASGERLLIGGPSALAVAPVGVRSIDAGLDTWFPANAAGLRLFTVVGGQLRSIDSVSFGVAVDDINGVAINEGAPAPLDPAASIDMSVSRCGDGYDDDDNQGDFQIRPWSIGAANDCP